PDVFTGLGGPGRPRREEVAGFLPGVWVSLTSLFNPSGKGVFGFEVGRGGCCDDFGSRKTAFLPIHTSIYPPFDDARKLGLELFQQRFVALLGRDRDGEGN